MSARPLVQFRYAKNTAANRNAKSNSQRTVIDRDEAAVSDPVPVQGATISKSAMLSRKEAASIRRGMSARSLYAPVQAVCASVGPQDVDWGEMGVITA